MFLHVTNYIRKPLEPLEDMKAIVKLKHWQVLLILVAPMLILIENLMISKLIPIFSFCFFFFWMFSIGFVLSREILKNDHRNMTYYIISHICAVLILLTLYGIEIDYMLNYEYYFDKSKLLPAWAEALLMLYALWSTIYIFYFTARTISLSNIQVNPEADSTTVNYFFGFWFYLIGIWFIQPKVKEILSEKGL